MWWSCDRGERKRGRRRRIEKERERKGKKKERVKEGEKRGKEDPDLSRAASSLGWDGTGRNETTRDYH